jgi:integrase
LLSVSFSLIFYVGWNVGWDAMADTVTDDAHKTSGKAKGRHPDKKLTAVTVRRAGPGRHADGGGLYLVVDPSGARRWLLRVVAQGKRRDIGLGGVQTVSLAEAREAARDLRAIARVGGNPLAARDKDKHAPLTFEDAARRVHAEQIVPNAKNGKHVAQWLSSLEAAAFPVMGAKPVAAVAQSDVLRVLSPIWTEKPETASRIRQRIRTVLDWARAAGFRDGINPVEGVELGLPRQKARVTHFAALPWKDLPGVIAQIAGTKGMGALALRFAILTAARSGEVRMAEWSEIDIAEKVWIIPAARMKAGQEHRVPLCDAAISVLHEAKALASRQEPLVFPSQKPGRPLSDMTLSAVLKRLEIAVTVHGFRSTFRDWTEEATAYPHEVKEAALAHTIKSKTERAYRRTDLFEKRREMMREWGAFAGGGIESKGAGK